MKGTIVDAKEPRAHLQSGEVPGQQQYAASIFHRRIKMLNPDDVAALAESCVRRKRRIAGLEYSGAKRSKMVVDQLLARGCIKFRIAKLKIDAGYMPATLEDAADTSAEHAPKA